MAAASPAMWFSSPGSSSLPGDRGLAAAAHANPARAKPVGKKRATAGRPISDDKALVMLRLRREKHTRRGRNQGDLARELGCSHSYLSQMLRGQKPLSPAALAYLGLKRVRTPSLVPVNANPARAKGTPPRAR